MRRAPAQGATTHLTPVVGATITGPLVIAGPFAFPYWMARFSVWRAVPAHRTTWSTVGQMPLRSLVPLPHPAVRQPFAPWIYEAWRWSSVGAAVMRVERLRRS